MVLLMAVMLLVMSAAPALADKPPQDPQPVQPPGTEIGQGDPPEQARDPLTGRANRYEHGQEYCEVFECF